MKKRIICLLMVLVLLLSTLPMTVLAAADAKPEKITLVGSSTELNYEKTGTLDYWGTDVPLYEVSVPFGTSSVSLYDSSVYFGSYGSGYVNANGLASATAWSKSAVGSSSPYTIETRIEGEDKPLSFVKHASYVGSNADGYILKFVGVGDPSAAPVLGTDLSTAQVSYTYGDKATALSVSVTGSGTLSYQWQLSTTSATDGFADISQATSASYTPATDKTGDYWYRVKVTNQETNKSKASVLSAVTPVRVSAPEGQVEVHIQMPVGYTSSRPLAFTLKNAAGQTVSLTKDTSTGFAVYDFFAKPGTYTYTATDTMDSSTYTLGTGTLTFAEGQENSFSFGLAYVYASNSGFTAADFTTELKDAAGHVMTPGDAYQFASYVGYPYFVPIGTYKYQVTPSAARAAEGYQASAVASGTLSANYSWNVCKTFSVKLAQVVTTTFTVAKGATVEVTTAGTASAYTRGTVQTPSATDTSGADQDVYSYTLTAGTAYLYRVSGVGRTKAERFTAGSEAKSFDLTVQKSKSASEVIRTVNASGTQTSDLRITGVDYTGLVSLDALGNTAQLTPHRTWQLGSSSTVGSTKNDILEPDFHYTVVDENGQPSDVATVSADGLITAKKNGVAYVLVTYDAIDVGEWSWSACANGSYGAIWPENTGVVVVACGSAAAKVDQTAGNFLLNETGKYNTTNYKTAGTHLDSELDPLYYVSGSGYVYTYTPASSGVTVEVLKPVLSQTALSFSGYETVSANTDGSYTLTLPEGKNVIRVTDTAGTASYQVVSVKKTAYVIENADDPGQPLAPGQTARITFSLTTPVGYTAKLYNATTQLRYTTPAGTTVTSTALSGGYGSAAERYEFDGTSAEAARTIEVKIPQQVGDTYTLTGGKFVLTGNFAALGTHHTTTSNSSTPSRSSTPVELGALPDIAIPVSGTSRLTEPTKLDGVYQIGTAGELKWFAAQVNSGDGQNYKAALTADIDLTGYQWIPIGNSSNPFSGTFDGQGHKISNLSIDSKSTSYVGLFGRVTGTKSSPAVIRGLTVASGSVKATGKNISNVGGIVGGVDSSYVTIENCVNYASVTVRTNEMYAAIGGIVGGFGDSYYIEGLTLSGCGNYGAIHTSTYTDGYMAGYAYAGAVGGVAGYCVGVMDVTSCYNCGSVTSGGRAGGVIGYYSGKTGNASVFKDLYNTGAISGGEYVGGIAGYLSANVSLTNAYSTTVAVAREEFTNASKNLAGGIIGGRTAALKNVYFFDGNLSASGDDGKSEDTAYARNIAALKALTVAELGGAFLPDTKNINDGFPVLAVQTEIRDFKITTLPTKTSYARLSSVDLTGIRATAVIDGTLTELDASMLTASPKTFESVGQQTVTVSFGGQSATFDVTVRELTSDDLSLETTLVDGQSRKGSRLTFDVVARINGNTKVSASDVVVKLNDSPVSYTWDDANKTSYAVTFPQSGDYTISITLLGVMTETYTIHYTKVETGEKIGEVIFSVEAFTLGGGYIIEPQTVDIFEGENAAQLLVRVLEENGFGYTKTGSLTSGFYLSGITGDALADIDTTGDSIPQILRDRMTIRPRTNAKRLGEFDYASGSGWMFSVNNNFPNVGFSGIYPDDGDVVRVQFTLAIGSDLGGGYATGGVSTDWYPTADKGELTTLLAERDCVVSEEILAVVTKVNATQAEADEAVSILKNAAAVEAAIDAIGTVTDDEACTARINAAQARFDALSETEQKNVRNASTLTDANAAVAARVDALIAAIGNVTADSGKAIAAARSAYDALTDAQKALCTGLSSLEAAERFYRYVLTGSKPSVPSKNEDAGQTEPTPDIRDYTDVSRSDWFYSSVRYVLDNGLMKGVSETEFAPNRTITRAMLVTILYRLEGEPETNGKHSFRDTDDSGWYADAVRWANENGIVTGYSTISFGPDDSITREQLASILFRYAKYKGYDTLPSADLSGYVDAGAVSFWSAEHVQWAVAQKLISGRSATELAPDGTATRAEAAAILERFCTTIA